MLLPNLPINLDAALPNLEVDWFGFMTLSAPVSSQSATLLIFPPSGANDSLAPTTLLYISLISTIVGSAGFSNVTSGPVSLVGVIFTSCCNPIAACSGVNFNGPFFTTCSGGLLIPGTLSTSSPGWSSYKDLISVFTSFLLLVNCAS